MRSKPKDETKCNISPVLFMTLKGEPMSFFLRPGSVKRELQPLIKAGGGVLCNVQKPGAILLVHPEERPSISKTTAHWYVSTQYIHDCIEKNEQLDLEAYRLNPETLSTNSKKPTNGKSSSPALSGGRSYYTPEEDTAILSFVSKRITEIGGNKLWQEMEKQQVTSHTWQSMKCHYRVQLAHKQSEFKEIETAQEKHQVADSTSAQNNDKGSSPQNISSETGHNETDGSEIDLTQISRSLEFPEAQTDIQQTECTESETYNSPKTEEALVQPVVDENPEPKQPEITLCCEKDGLLETSSPATHEKASPKLGRQSCSKPSRRPLTRQQLELEDMSYGIKLRSSSTTPKKSFKVPYPKPPTKTKAVAHSTPKKDISGEQPPSKRARGNTGANVAEHFATLEENEPSSPSEKPQPDEATRSVRQIGEKKAEKRKLGILELATKEFEDESEPESLDAQNQDITVPGQCTSTDPVVGALNPEDPPLSTSNVQQGTSPIRPEQEAQPTTADPTSNASDSAVAEPAITERSKNPAATEETSKAHLFIFDSESQEEEDSQSLVGNASAPADPQTNGNKGTALSSSQVHLEEDMQLLRDLMSQTNQDLASVTKALLKTSGVLNAARELLLNPSSAAGPFWTRSDDQLLRSAEPEVHLKLQAKYGKESVAQRVIFLEVDEQNR